MLGAVKMEGHEPSDWSSYYAEPEVSARGWGAAGGGTRDRGPARTAPHPAARTTAFSALLRLKWVSFFIRHTVSLEIILTL